MISDTKSIYFIGICGTAMASIAASLKMRGFDVSGSDNSVYPPMSKFLEERAIHIHNGYSEDNLKQPDLVVIGNAVSRGNPEVEAVLARSLRYCSLPDLQREFFIRGKRCLVVSGTHGKTTTASLLAWVLSHNGLSPSYLIGGIPNNFAQGVHHDSGQWVVIEGDEYDSAFFDKRSKFVHYLPEVAIINNLEFDHADIFEDIKAVQVTFERLIRLVPRNGLLLANGDEDGLRSLIDIKYCPVKTFGLSDNSELRAENITITPEGSKFVVGGQAFNIPLVGEFNVRNALAVIACARYCGLNDQDIQSAFEQFRGVKRRMEIRGIRRGIVILDDFGHHPTAIRETLKALRCMYPTRRIWAIFEPRSNTTRRNVFQKELVAALSHSDISVVAEIARPLPKDKQLDVQKLVSDLQKLGNIAISLPLTEDIIAYVLKTAMSQDVICVFTNGGFDNIHTKLLDRL